MRKVLSLAFLVVLPSLVVAVHTAPEHCAHGDGSCAAPGVGSKVEQDDAGLEPAVDFIQKASWKEALRAAEGLGNRSSVGTSNQRPTANAIRHLVLTDTSAVSGCALLGDAELPPLALGSKADLLALHEVGLVQTNSSRSCLRTTAASFPLFAHKTVQEKNLIAYRAVVIWSGLVGAVIIWSILSVALQPRKPKVHSAHFKKLNLADEEGAWKRGFMHWASLTWADDLMGRYGKCYTSVIDDRELIEDRMDEDYAPYMRCKNAWMAQVEAKGMENASLFLPFMQVIGARAILALLTAIVIELFMVNVGMVIALDKFLGHLEYMEREQYTHPEAQQSYLESAVMIMVYIFGVPMIFRTCTIVVNLLDGYYTNVCAAGLASIVFEKALSLPVGAGPPDEDDELLEGYLGQNMKPNVVQLLNVDIIECWAYLLKTIVYIAVSPLIIMALFTMLIRKIKLAGLIGVLYILPCTLLSMKGMGYNVRAWIRYQGHQDERLRWLTETIIHIRTIKSLAWEKLSFEKLHKVRTKELQENRLCGIIGGVVGAIGSTMPWGTMLIAVYVSLATEGFVEAHTIIIIQRLMGSLLNATSIMMNGAHKFVTVPNSFRRIRKFLMEHDLPKDVIRPPALLTPNAPVVRLSGSFSYVDKKPAVLHDLDITIQQGEFVAIVGTVACGKSALLNTILGELYPVEDAYVEAPLPGKGQVAYCSQVPWIFEGTLRDNVLLNQDLQAERYHSALYAAALMQDLEILPGGDQVTIGSYGIRLSGGQRARVALARAAYAHAPVVVIDDPFASVDMPTGQHICTELLLGPLLQGRTRIVVMQPNPTKLRHADRVILIDAGRVVAQGPPAEVMGSPAFQELMVKDDGDQSPSAGDGADGGAEPGTQQGGEGTARVCERKASEAANVLREQELQDHVTLATAFWWLKAAGFHNLGFFFGMMIVGRWVNLWEVVTLARWVDDKVYHDVNDVKYMLNVIRVVLCNCMVMVISAYAATRVMMSASTQLHAKVVHAILRAPVDKFFDKQPVGRLINRLSFDMRRVDDAILGTITALLGFVTGFIVTESYILRVVPLNIALASVPVFGASFFFIYIFRGTATPLVFHAKFALSTAQDLQATVLTSCVSIRANGVFDLFMRRFNHCSHSVIRSNYLIYHVCACWVCSRVFLCFTALTCLFAVGGLWTAMPLGTLSAVIAQQYGQMSEFEGLSGSFTAFLNILNALQRLTKYFDAPQEAMEQRPGDVDVRRRILVPRGELSELVVRIAEGASAGQILVCWKDGTPVLQSSPDGGGLVLCAGRRLADLGPACKALQETVQEYVITGVNSVNRQADQMAQELCSPSTMVWIDLWHSQFSQGMRVQIESLTAGYASEKNVLHGISVDIAPRTKLGFAGKTGCGKSTTMLCLLRLLEPRGGRILFGGIDASTMGLNCLRHMIGLVPQDPTIFEGTVRTNIDPFEEYPDARIWECLRSMQLLPWVRLQKGGIGASIAKEGSNMSFGQRQLLSLARMVIRQPPVLLLDECTSALDPNTQQVVQDIILNEFPATTVIAIAHRVETILDFDRVIVLEAGQVAEQGTIDEVLEIQKGIFHNMVKIAKPEVFKKP